MIRPSYVTHTLALSTFVLACGGGTAGSDASTDAPISDVNSQDAQDSGPTDGASNNDATDAATFKPTSLTGLVLWLDANVGVTVTSTVSAWADQSGNNNNATQGTANFQPTVNATGVKGKPSIHFEAGTHLGIADTATLQWGTGDFYVALVMKEATASNTYGMVFSKQAPNYPFPGPGIFANFTLPSQTTTWGGQEDYTNYISTATTGLNNNAAHQFSFARAGTVLSVRIDGAPDGTNATDAGATDVSAVGSVVSIGANTTGGQALTGDIAEIIAVKGTTSQSDITNVEAYLKTKYSL